MPAAALEKFGPLTRTWFRDSFGAPTSAQEQAWDAISAGDSTLVVAPTGSGKTLAAFLWALDRLASRDSTETAAPTDTAGTAPGTRVLYISPLKALAVDVERNLRAPLAGMARVAADLGLTAPDITVGVRSGDTPAAQRRALVRTPPDILITTPESLFLMLTSGARDTLRTVDTVIIDEIHALAGTKRGTHLALSLARLDALLEHPAQRIGLSATVRPPELVGQFLTGGLPCRIVAPPITKRFDLSVRVPVADMANIPSAPDSAFGDDPEDEVSGSIWPHVEAAIADLVAAHRTTIVFANSRRLAERLTARLNEIHAERSAPTHNAAVPGGAPALTMSSGATAGAQPTFAAAHHGSVSKEQRAQIEDDLKAGRLRAVVATGSLELGIDMGAVNLVIQVQAPPSIASGLQRVGRAGHQVGEVSRGVLFPKHRTDLLHSAVAVQRMRSGAIEAIAVPRNPLDILAQHTVAAAAMDDLDADEWFATVRRAFPYAELPRAAYDGVLDLLSGRYPSAAFGELRPRLVYDRIAGTLTGRPGAARLALTSGGAIPDRGLFGVFMVGEKATRVGELDEEMVYESRVGDVFALGASSWRIEDITHDRVLVSPAPGQPGRLPFWIGDSVGRAVEFGAAIGEFLRRDDDEVAAAAAEIGLDERAIDNLLSLLQEQRAATGHLPTDDTLVVERFRDELGDWRVVLHSPFGLRVHAPWASAVGARLRQTHGLDGAVTAADDGILVRVPDTDAEPPGAELFVIDPDEVEDLVTRELAGSAMFAARFREAAARALLLPRRHPGKRSPLWQQRQRSAQLLQVAQGFPDFPIILEAVRECLNDVYDLPALRGILAAVAARSTRLVTATTELPSPFASAMLFGYVGSVIYDDDTPLAERRAAALSLDPRLLAQLLGRVDLRELLDPDVIVTLVDRLQRRGDYAARDGEGITDVLRWLGPLTAPELAARYSGPDLDAELQALHQAGRVFPFHRGDAEWWAVVEDAARLRDGLGVPLPPGIPAAFTEPVADPLGDLLIQFARAQGPFIADAPATRFGLGTAVVHRELDRLAAAGIVVAGSFTPDLPDITQWCHNDVLTSIRRASLAASRGAIEPVVPAQYARFLYGWHHLDRPLRGADGLYEVVEQLAGVAIPASAWETLVLPPRIRDYSPALLDELTTAGDVVWAGRGRLSAADAWVSVLPRDLAPALLPEPAALGDDAVQRDILTVLTNGGGRFYSELVTALDSSPDAVATALTELAYEGFVTNDTFAPLRAASGTRRPTARTHRAARGRRPARLAPYRLSTTALAARTTTPPHLVGRWSLLPERLTDPTLLSAARCDQLLQRCGVVTRGSDTDPLPGGFARLYAAYKQYEEAGSVRRGYFIEGLGGAQFATAATVDRLRDAPENPGVVIVAATDPANPYGAGLPWPEPNGSGHKPGRKAGALVALADGELGLYLERGGRTAVTFGSPDAAAIAQALTNTPVGGLHLERLDGAPIMESSWVAALTDAGFVRSTKGLRLRR